MARYVVVVIRDSDPVALSTNFLASRRNNLAKRRIGNIRWDGVCCPRIPIGAEWHWLTVCFCTDGKSVSNGKNETVTGFSNAEEEQVGKLEVGGVATQHVPWRCREKSGRHGAPVRVTLFSALELDVPDAKRSRGEHPYIHRRRTMSPRARRAGHVSTPHILHRGWPRS